MKNSEFTKSGYPAGNEVLRDYIKEMLKIGEKHKNIKDFNDSLRSIETQIRNLPKPAKS